MDKVGVYILQSIKNKRYYIGSTKNIDKRLNEHNRGLIKATKFILPLKLVVFLECETEQKARKSEYRLKKYKNKRIIEKTVNDAIFPWEYKLT